MIFGMQLGKNQIVTTAKTVVLPFFYDLQIGKPLGGKMLAQQRNRIIRGTIVHNKKAACYPLCALEKSFHRFPDAFSIIMRYNTARHCIFFHML